jgi:pimeloyl-ACP methyl ester carboxylesterase
MAELPASDLHVTVRGHGEPLLLIHGSLTGDPAVDDWREQASLAEHYQLRMVARRGYFKSPDRPAGYGFEAESDDLAALLSAGSHVVGHSYGGFLALLTAAKRPHAVRSLTLIEPSALSVARGDPDLEALISRLTPVTAAAPQMSAEQYLLAFRRALRGLPPEAPLELSEQDRRELADPVARRGIEAARLEQPQWEAAISLAALAAAPFPKLVVSGGWSRAFEAICAELERRLPAERSVIGGAGHAVQMVGEPFNQRLLTFLRTASAS